MKLSNGNEIIVKPYQEEDAEEIVNLIIRNFGVLQTKLTKYKKKEHTIPIHVKIKLTSIL